MYNFECIMYKFPVCKCTIPHADILYYLKFNSTREMYQPSSAIYSSPESGDGLSDCLFDQEAGTRSADKEVRPFRRHNPARGTLAVRALGGYKSNESNFLKV